jgi:hypothetical protein
VTIIYFKAPLHADMARFWLDEFEKFMIHEIKEIVFFEKK